MMPCVPEPYFSKVDTSIEKETQQHIDDAKFQIPSQSSNCAFYEYLILNLINENLHIKQEIFQLKQMICSKSYGNMESLSEGINYNKDRKKRKYERKGVTLERKFLCHHKNCERSYSSRIALNSHLRKKHTVKKICSVQNIIQE